MRIHQLVPALRAGDAIGDYARLLQRHMRGWGHDAAIYAEAVQPGLEAECRPIAAYRPGRDDLALLHDVYPSAASAAFLAAPARRALIYHNITPAAFFDGRYPELAERQRTARESLGKLARHVRMAITPSAFNQRELDALGFPATRVVPLLIDWEAHDRLSPDAQALRRFADGRTNLLVVGRVAPHKRLEDAIDVFARYRRWIDPHARLVVVGGAAGFEDYRSELVARAAALGVLPDVHILGHVPFETLLAAYRSAAVLLSMSEHEGFCVPLVEAMRHGVPVLAFDAGAVCETLGTAGVRLLRKEPAIAAELVHLLVSDPVLRERVVAGQRERLAAFAPEAVAAQLRACLAELAE